MSEEIQNRFEASGRVLFSALIRTYSRPHGQNRETLRSQTGLIELHQAPPNLSDIRDQGEPWKG